MTGCSRNFSDQLTDRVLVPESGHSSYGYSSLSTFPWPRAFD